ncbi:SCO family protein [Modestobacter muralis]|uniref:SCO family protein n=1 Tax=Modestobacter muralis TaxID=1608614 RepID=A0A6P0H5Z3_9ACTN|nr:SCO family protein [Modestobacter muralis]NEN50136.1 SCO family protein [Modestobacter muralis]
MGLVATASAVSACSTPISGAPVSDIVSAQEEDGYAGTLLSDPTISRPALVLTDTDGRPYDLQADVDGVTALFFGYTRCPDVCPTTMADLATAVRELPAGARERVDVVFVTEDPDSDTPAVVREWLDRFDEDFIGLMGGQGRTDQVLDQLHVPRTEGHVDPPEAAPHDDGTLEHSGVVYLFGPGDEATVLHSGGTTADQYAADISRLLDQS